MSYSYQLRAGTLAWRAMNWLRTFLGDNASGEISTTAWAAGLQVTTPDLISAMQPVLKARLVFSRQKGGHIRSPLFWSLVDHSINGAAPKGIVMGPAIASEAAPPMDTPQRGLTEVRPRDEVMESEACESATDRGNGAPALAIAPSCSPSVGSMGTGQPADAGAVVDEVHRWIREHSGVDIDAVHRQKPKGLAGAARGPETAEETTHRGAAHNGAGEDAKRDGGPASPGGFACGVDLGRSDSADAFAYVTRALGRRERPAVHLVTISFTVPLHVAERLMRAAADLTEVRS